MFLQACLYRPSVRALFIGESEAGFSSLYQRLRKDGCQCEFVPSCSCGAELFPKCSFDLIFCGVGMKDFGALVSATLRSPASLFRYLRVEEGCWWVPTVLRGKPCVGASALRPREFAKALDHFIFAGNR